VTAHDWAVISRSGAPRVQQFRDSTVELRATGASLRGTYCVGRRCFNLKTVGRGRAIEAYNRGNATDVTGIAPSDAADIVVTGDSGQVVRLTPRGNVYAASVRFLPRVVTVFRTHHRSIRIRLYER
jgi:hypothetical protein